jgi:hypothetical protein
MENLFFMTIKQRATTTTKTTVCAEKKKKKLTWMTLRDALGGEQNVIAAHLV